MNLPTLDEWTRGAHALTGAATAAGIAVVLALAVHLVLFAGLKRITRLSAQTADEEFVARLHQPARWSLVAVAVSLAAEANPALAHIWDMVARFVVPESDGWTSSFCPTCGSPAPHADPGGKIYFVPAGLLDDDPGFRGYAAHIFVESKAPWVRITDDAPQYTEGFGSPLVRDGKPRPNGTAGRSGA